MPIIQQQKSFGKLRQDRKGVAAIELAYTLPIFMLLTFTGIELTHLAIASMRVNQIAMTVADNLSRAKQSVGLTLPVLREVDVNDALIGAKIQGGDTLEILENGRIIVSSLQQDSAGKQTILWQRCKGKNKQVSAYGTEGTTQPKNGSSGFQGMGSGAHQVKAEPNSAIIFAEVVYTYDPLFADWVLGKPVLRREAAFYVRDDRALGKPENYVPKASVAECSQYSSTF